MLLRPVNRYALRLAGRADVLSAHDALVRLVGSGVSHLDEVQEDGGEAWFVLSDLDANWWEVTSSSEPNLLALG